MRLLPGAFRNYYDNLTTTKARARFLLILNKRFFDQGHGIFGYFNFFIVGFAAVTRNLKETLYVALFYAIFYYIVGWAWFYFDWMEVENEVSNLVNIFVRDMRDMKQKVLTKMGENWEHHNK